MATFDETRCQNLEIANKHEWLLPNGLGGFAMGTVSGIATRRYHGLLVAAVEPPTHRMVLLAAIDATVQADGQAIGISSNQYPGAIYPEGYHYLRSFSCTDRSARWVFRGPDIEIERLLIVHQGQNAITVRYVNRGQKPVQIVLRPLVAHKDFHGNFQESAEYPEQLEFPRNMTKISHQGVSLFLNHPGAQRLPIQGWYYRFEYAREVDRGLNARDDLFCPCEIRYELLPGEEAVLVASTEDGVPPQPFEHAESPATTTLNSLKSSVRKFIVQTPVRTTILAGYPWFTDWGRDVMISLPGVCLATGEFETARKILRDYASQCRNGLIPNRFTELAGADYNTVDATLWFVNAVYKTLLADWNEEFAAEVFPTLQNIFLHHVQGTLFGIKVDPIDGLLSQGEAGVQLTWMDAKIGDWVVTPRHGKPVEINGLWINACRVMEWLADRLGEDSTDFREAAEKAEANFEAKFWHAGRGHYLDTVDPTDASLRPNQVIAMALPFAPAKGEKALAALNLVGQELLTRCGLRTLGPKEPGYRGKFKGPLPDLDAAYHQGTVWPWLLGPFVSAFVKLTGDRQEARKILHEARFLLDDYGIDGIAECYDGDQPQQPGGCPFQAWSVAELLRAWTEDLGEEN
jgi:predicted glycogen debranching enzyme